MALWQQIQQTITQTASTAKAIAVDSVETLHHHRALSLNKKADTIRSSDVDVKGAAAAVEYFKEKASIAATARQNTANIRLSDSNRSDSGNRLVDFYDVITSDLQTLKEAGSVLWGYVETADRLARATVKDTQEDVRAVVDSIDRETLQQATKETVEEITTPIQQVWQQVTDNLRSWDLDRKGQEMVDYFQELGRDR